MNGLQKSGGCLTMLGIPFVFLAVFMYLDPPDGDTPLQGFVAGAFFASVLLGPGLLLWFAGARARREREFFDAVTGLVRSHDRFTVVDLAAKIGRTELETGAIVARIAAAQNGIDLVFHRPTREYLHRGRLAAGERVVERCAACGAPTENQVVFEGEQVPCTYCNAPLRVD